MCCADHFSPLCRGQLVAREDKTDFVVKNFCGGTGQGIEAIIAQHGEVVGQRHARKLNSVDNFHGREGVNVHPRYRFLHRAQDVPIMKRRQLTRQASLNANFGGANLPGVDGFLCDLIEVQEIRVGVARPPAEGAKFASHEADVGEIDVAIDDVGHQIAHQFSAQHIRRHQQAEEIVT